MSVTAYPTLRLKLTMPQALKLQFLPAVPGSNASAAADRAEQAAQDAQDAANTAVAATTNKVDKSGDAMSGFLTLNADPTASLHAATKHYVDILGTSGIPEAPNDGSLYARQSLGWAAAQPFDADLTSLASAIATNAIYYRSAANTWSAVTIGANLTFTGGTLAATGGGGGAPTTAEYITSTADATLSAERVLTDTASITWDRTTAGQIKANTAAGGGNVSNSGTPTAGQYGKWVTATTIQGVAVGTVLTDIGAQPLDATLTSLAAYNTNGLLTQTAADTFTGRTLTGPAAGIAVTNGNGVSGNPTLALANDLAALEGLAGTNNIYYRAGADTWSSVTIGTGLTFTGGTLNATGGGGVSTVQPQGRLTLVSGTPVMTSTQSDKSTIFYTPYFGSAVPIYNGSSWSQMTFSEISSSISGAAANKNQDWFVWNNGGTVALIKGPDWTDDATRSLNIERLSNGIWVNSSPISGGPTTQQGTYVGTTRTYLNVSVFMQWTYALGAGGGAPGFFGVFNCYNRVRVASRCLDNTSTWTYQSATPRQKNGSTGNQIAYIAGLREESFSVESFQTWINGAAGESAITGVAINSTTAFGDLGGQGDNRAGGLGNCTAVYRGLPVLGWNIIYPLEACTGIANPVTFVGNITTSPPRYNNSLVWDFMM